MSEISLCHYGCQGFRCVKVAVGTFAALLWLPGICRVAVAIGNFAVLLQLAGISLCCNDRREFRRVATAVGNFAVLLQLS